MEEVDTELWELLYHQLYLSGIIQNVFSEFWMCVCVGGEVWHLKYLYMV